MRIDAHQHFWNYDPVKDAWISDEMKVLKRDFGPTDIEALLKSTGFEGCIAVQADQSEKETEFLLALANDHRFIKGVVGWIDLVSDDLEDRLIYFHQYPLLKGFRHILQDEQDRAFMLKPQFTRGIRFLSKYGYSYDLLVYPDQLSYCKELVYKFPEQLFVLDHLGKPPIKSGAVEDWRKDITTLAAAGNIYCKLSGFVTEADWKNWTKEQFYPYFDVIVQAFGTKRLMFGSDWPVCLLAAPYEDVYKVVNDYFASFSETERENIFGNNAVRFYKL